MVSGVVEAGFTLRAKCEVEQGPRTDPMYCVVIMHCQDSIDVTLTAKITSNEWHVAGFPLSVDPDEAGNPMRVADKLHRET